MRVTWDATQLDRLAAYYGTLSLDDQRALAGAVGQANRALGLMPLGYGESR